MTAIAVGSRQSAVRQPHRAEGQSRAAAAEEDTVAAPDAACGDRLGEGERQGGGHAVAAPRDVADDLGRGEAKALGQEIERVATRLVRDNRREVGAAPAEVGEEAVEEGADQARAVTVNARPIHVEEIVLRRGGRVVGVVQRAAAAHHRMLRAARMGHEARPPERARLPRLRARHDRGGGGVTEEDGALALVGVEGA